MYHRVRETIFYFPNFENGNGPFESWGHCLSKIDEPAGKSVHQKKYWKGQFQPKGNTAVRCVKCKSSNSQQVFQCWGHVHQLNEQQRHVFSAAVSGHRVWHWRWHTHKTIIRRNNNRSLTFFFPGEMCRHSWPPAVHLLIISLHWPQAATSANQLIAFRAPSPWRCCRLVFISC